MTIISYFLFPISYLGFWQFVTVVIDGNKLPKNNLGFRQKGEAAFDAVKSLKIVL